MSQNQQEDQASILSKPKIIETILKNLQPIHPPVYKPLVNILNALEDEDDNMTEKPAASP